MTPSGSTIRAARSCSNEVSTTVPSRTSLMLSAISSRPGASGILDRLCGSLERLGGRLGLAPRPLLGADRVVALAPAEVWPALNQPLQLVEAMEEGLGAGWAAGDVDIDRHELVRPLDHRIVREHAARGGAGAHRDHPARLQH